MLIERIHHAQITIPLGAEDRGREFFCGVLGLQEIAKPESLAGRGGFWVVVGEQELHVGTEDGVDRDATKAHVAFQVDDLDGWRSRLEACGCTVLESVPIPGMDRFEFRDPFGNRMEMLSTHPQR
jgi:catechol 2,3-dioxygenase-like lactoylglutathione lyase family enzyme